MYSCAFLLTFSPRITNQFHSLEDVGWYASAYLLTSTSLQPTYGKVYQNFNLKWIFIAVVAIFELGSLVCAVAPNSTTFIVGRAIAGLGAGGIFAGALTIIAYSVPLRKRPMFTGVIGAMFGVCPIPLELANLISDCQCCRAFARRRFHRSYYMEMVLLYQSPYRRRHHYRNRYVLEESGTTEKQ
jgi:Major Facilitator Superfamily